MTDSPNPLSPDEIAEGRRLFDAIEYSKLTYEDKYPLAEGFYAWLVEHADRLLAAAERLAECERQLAEARAVIVFDRHPDSDFTWKRPPFYAAAVEAAHAASRQPKEPEHE